MDAATPATSRPGIDIVDAQLHVGRGRTEATLAAMDALGIRSVLIDEFWGEFGTTHPTHLQPGHALPTGAWRAAWPTAQEAALRHPDRFAYLVRIDRLDPQLEHVMRTVASSPGARAFRLQPVWTLDEAAALAGGAYDEVLDLAQDIGLPVFFFVPGYAELLRPYAERFERLTFVVDHCGMGFRGIPAGRPAEEAARTLQHEYFTEVLRLAELPNVALKWSHPQDLFGVHQYPYEPLRPLLRQAIEAFGPQRVMWASDSSVVPAHTWAEMLFCLREDPELSGEEKAWILGRSAREILDWPAA